MTGSFVVAVVGVAAALCSMGSFLPQVVKILREKDAASVSVRMYMVTVTGFALWSAYGVLLKSWPLAGSNLVSLILSGLILILKLRYPGRRDAAQAATQMHGRLDCLVIGAGRQALRPPYKPRAFG